MTPVTDAIKAAVNQLVQWFPKAQDILLEEVEISDDDRFFLITLGYGLPRIDATQTPISRAMSALAEPRQYKIFKIDRQTGEVRSMKMRSIEHV